MNALVTIETLTAPVVFAPGGAEDIVSKLELEVRALPARDMSVKADREEVRTLAAKIARSKTGLDDLGKEFTADIDKQRGAVLASRKLIRDRLDALRDEVRAPLTAFEESEAKRVADHEAVLVWVAHAPQFDTAAPSPDAISQRLLDLGEKVDREWEEFAERAGEAYQASAVKLNAMHLAALQAERDAAELAELRALKAKREADDIAAAAERTAAEAAAANAARAEQARIEAEQKAARDAAAAAEKARLAEIALAEQAKRDAAAAAEKAVEDERKRVAKIAADEKIAADKREANKRNRAKVHSEIMSAFADENMIAEFAERVLEAIAAGRIPHVSITY